MPSLIKTYLNELKKSGQLHDGFLLSAEQRNLIKEAFTKEKIKIKKNTLPGLTHSVIQNNDGTLFAILGFTREIPQGGMSIMKVAQNLTTGEFCLVKINRIKNIKEQHNKKAEVEEETAALKKYPRMFLGSQSRSKLFESKSDKLKSEGCVHYNFIKILPGIPLNKLRKELCYGSPLVQCKIALGILRELEALKQCNLVHRDIHTQNILVDPVTWEVNIIDLGFAISVNDEGYCLEYEVADAYKKLPKVLYANGADAREIWNTIPFGDKTLDSIFKKLYLDSSEKAVNGRILKYNVVDLQPVIASVRAYYRICNMHHEGDFIDPWGLDRRSF